MAKIYPFQPYRYAETAGDLNHLVTQPYDKISPAMRSRYLSLSPHNLVRVILGEKSDADTESDNVYTRAARSFREWIDKKILVRDDAPAFYAYFQEFTLPDSGERLTRKGFIGLGKVEEYSAGIVHRHEQTLSGPKKDRRQVLEHTGAHFGQIFMLYPDPQGEVDAILDQAATGKPAAQVTDEYGAVHTLYGMSDPGQIERIQELMDDKKLLIADGHHRYETALAFHHDNPDRPGADKVMMTFVNMHAPGLRILATHRVLSSLSGFDPKAVVEGLGGSFQVKQLQDLSELKEIWAQPDPEKIRIAMAYDGGKKIALFERSRDGKLDVPVLHEEILEQQMHISPEAVREEKYIQYVRGADAAIDLVRSGKAQVAFLLEPTTVEQVAGISFGGGVMPQKSTDFYPKLLTGVTIYRLED